MVGGLDAVRGGGSSISVGTTGKISVLMRRELESPRCESSQTPVSCRRKCPTGGSLRSSSHSSQGSTHRKTCKSRPSACRVPILSSDQVSLDRTPNRDLTVKKGSRVVEIVDLNCGNSERAWSSPMANRLKKLGFSRLSQTIN